MRTEILVTHSRLLAPSPILFALLHLSFLGPVLGERPNVTQNNFLLSGHHQLLTHHYLPQIVFSSYLYVCVITACVKTACSSTCVDNSVKVFYSTAAL